MPARNPRPSTVAACDRPAPCSSVHPTPGQPAGVSSSAGPRSSAPLSGASAAPHAIRLIIADRLSSLSVLYVGLSLTSLQVVRIMHGLHHARQRKRLYTQRF